MEIDRVGWAYIFAALFALLAFGNVFLLRSTTERGSHSVIERRWRVVVTIGIAFCAALNLIWAIAE